MSTSIAVNAFPDSVLENSETITATIASSSSYTIGAASSANVMIVDPPFDFWKTTNFSPAELAAPELGGDAADFDHDGRSNFLEYALGKNPRAPDVANLPAPAWQGSTELRLYYAKGGSGLTFEVEQSPQFTAPAWSRSGVGPELYDSASGLFYQAVTVSPNETTRFLRLRVTKP